MKLEPDKQIGDYRVLSRIGGGAYGEVFRAEHVITQRIDAIKIQVRGRLGAPEEEQRFLREIQVQASLQHPNIAAVHNAFWAAEGLVLVMEWVEGEPLSAILARGRVPLATGMGYVSGMLKGLEYAHTHEVIHRDIKPENLMVLADGSVKLTDFGLARSASSPRLTQAGEFAGSPSYMAPEQVLGRVQTDARSDIYSTGVVLYEVVTGRPPFQGDSGFTVMMAHQNEAPQPPEQLDPSVPPEVSRAILRALEKNPDHRFQTAAEFLAAIAPATATAPVPAPAPFPSRAPRPRAMLGVLMAAMCAIACLALLLLTMRVTAPMRQVPVTFTLPPEPVEPPTQRARPPADPPAAVATPDSPPPAPSPSAPRKRSPAKPLPPLAGGIRVISTEPPAAVDPGAARSAPPAAAPAEASPPDAAGPESGPPTPPAEPSASQDAKRSHPVVRALRKVFHR